MFETILVVLLIFVLRILRATEQFFFLKAGVSRPRAIVTLPTPPSLEHVNGAHRK